MTDDSRIVQEDLNSSIGKTKVELEGLLEFSKNEIGNITNSINFYKKTLDILCRLLIILIIPIPKHLSSTLKEVKLGEF
ncbi:hypothetical protein RCL_jg16826.t1 [Rhizophagus clarus]|uniref:Uncharacterized protein n=1 Tax=Rhizophagus clarus TaxID=94130 RepID=A0A8H3LER5_9GLOM|nr:hypothetical protein RCL_jg16826.t1 [Rhizophagus clarus]